ncbi:hypothetical protein F4861DRAFT_409811 [Xylaria intraflava]|nr:hypothetical protein F4861DRAFT_409811 [Xylaria intraflava]
MAYQPTTAPAPAPVFQAPTESFAGPPPRTDIRPPAPIFGASPEPIVEAPFRNDIQSLKRVCERELREYAALRVQGGVGSENVHALAIAVVRDLRLLRAEVSAMLKRGVTRRWRKWLLGGFIAAIVPTVRGILRRSDDDRVSSNDTEHAFRKSKSLIARILDSVKLHGKSGIASVAFFVLAVLYLFQSEVSVRVAKTVSKRLKRLMAKVEDGVDELTEQDLKVLNGWRWRVLLW